MFGNVTKEYNTNSNNSSGSRATSSGVSKFSDKTKSRNVTPIEATTTIQIESPKASTPEQSPRQKQEKLDQESESEEDEDEIVSETEFEISEKVSDVALSPRNNIIYIDTTITTHK